MIMVWSVGSDLMAMNHGLGRFRNDAHGLSRAVQTWTVVKKRNCEDSSRGKICGDWVIVDRCEVMITYCACCELMIA
ncbi:hypothetical protein IGI04_022691 [Brassica rapa subsp. trilocularis]|uniref:Uncharacterized protein n=1 Tax=Brassica rapa subsp. trilocularis TaxID=1813537 RepID=A0ABQ7M3Y0_BRACM|nr:hypothetical protein IGI04_022691 [Brassica rapa subsp. trilocularis]